MGLLISLKSSMSEIVNNIGWMFSITIVCGAIIMILIDYFKGKLK
jgi:hypothetical protein